MDNKNHPLVSVFVVTYNSGDYICETLDSIKAQTYDNIELIVSDDHSSDATVSLANEWIEKNRKRFVRTEVITIDHNTGVSANYNRAVVACRGEWVKNVDGDDLLCDNCIADNIDFVINNPSVSLVFSNVFDFRDGNPRVILGEHVSSNDKKLFELNADNQFKALLKANFIPSQSCFVKLDILHKYPYNESYRGLEDEPMWITLTRNGIKAYFFDKCTSYYRKGESTISSRSRYYSPIYKESVFAFFWNEKVKYIKENNHSDAYNANRRYLLLLEFCELFLNNRKTKIHNLIYRMVYNYIYKRVFFKL